MFDIGSLEIEKIIFHEVKKQKIGPKKDPPIFSEIESDLDDAAKNVIKSRIILTIGSPKSHDIIFSSGDSSPVPEIVKYFLKKRNNDSSNIIPDFVKKSKIIAQHLNNIQTGVNPGGFVTIIIGKNKKYNLVALLKIERDEGVRLEETVKDGKKTFKINNIKDLILTKNTKFFKISLFRSDTTEEGKYSGMICDNQLSGKTDYANFFLKQFLGCNLTDDPLIKTQDFYDVSMNFFKQKVDDPVTQSKYRLHLFSYLSNEGNMIQPRKFASSALQTNHRDSYEKYLIDKGVGIKDIIRNTALIDRSIKSMFLEFENGIKIIGNQDKFEENVKTEQLVNGDTKAEVISRLKKQ
ncbi:MAG: nucleoid-associated protein [Methanoregula sp.]|jgi:hypothetical protein|nr:nucleoid-associated protein [Methanoregula sp.]